MTMDNFKFQNTLPVIEPTDYLGELNVNIYDKKTLLSVLSTKLKFPDYFGMNWDALTDSLCDFNWIKENRIILFHSKMPMLEKDDLQIYLDILDSSIELWKKYPDEHVFQVYFPTQYETTLLNLKNPFNGIE